MKKTISIMLTLLMTMVFTACADTPSQVKDDMSAYRDDSRNKSDETDFTYIPISELSENVEAALNGSYSQFSISDKIKFVQPDELHIMSFEKSTNAIKNYEKAMALFFSAEELASQNVVTQFDENNKYYMIQNEPDKMYCCVAERGFIAALRPETFDISFSYNEPNVKIYHADRSDDLSDEYELEDGKHSVAEAVDYVNNWFEANYGQFSPDFDYKVETIIVRKHEEGYLYQILVHALYKGVPLDSYTRAAEKPDGTNVPKMTNLDYGVSIQIVRSDEISSFTNGGCIIKPVEVEAVDKCISLDSALRFCEDKFSNFKDITISDIDIMYTLIPVYEPVPDEPDKQELVRYDSRPVWEFVIDVDPTEFIKEGEVNTRGDVRKYIYIDMITGELKYDFEVRRY